jgi:hypothetical protein
MKTPYLYKIGGKWWMDTTITVGTMTVPITFQPDSHHIALWEAYKAMEQNFVEA